MLTFKVAAAAAVLLVCGAKAQASVTTLTFDGTLNNLYDGGLVFGSSANTQYNRGTGYTGTISFTTPTTSVTPCTATTNPCSFALSDVTETLSITGAAKQSVSFSSTTGTLINYYNGGNSEQIAFSGLTGPGLSFTGTEAFGYQQFQDGSSFFATSPSNSAALSFSKLGISGTGNGSLTTTYGQTSIGFKFTSLSASTVAGPATAVPEPVTIALLGTSLATVGLIRRRRRA